MLRGVLKIRLYDSKRLVIPALAYLLSVMSVRYAEQVGIIMTYYCSCIITASGVILIHVYNYLLCEYLLPSIVRSIANRKHRSKIGYTINYSEVSRFDRSFNKMKRRKCRYCVNSRPIIVTHCFS